MIKKILYISSQSEMVGGGQRNLYLLLQNIDRGKFFPMVLFGQHGTFSDMVVKLNIAVDYCFFPGLLKFNIIAVFKALYCLKRFIQKNAIDLVHTDAPRETFYAGLVCRLLRVPLVWHIRVSDKDRIWDWLLYCFSTSMIAVSRFAAGRFSLYRGWKKKIKVIYSGIDIEQNIYSHEQEIEWRKKQQILSGDFLVGIASRVIPQKGIEDIIQLAASLSSDFPSIKFVVAGYGIKEYVQHLKALVIEKKLVGKVIFTGFLEEMSLFYRSIDIFILASYCNEGLSRSILEAMSFGKPVISYAVGGCPEAIEENINGFLVPVGDIQLLKKQTVFLYRNQDIGEKMGETGKTIINQNFTLDKNVLSTETIYEKILNKPG